MKNNNYFINVGLMNSTLNNRNHCFLPSWDGLTCKEFARKYGYNIVATVDDIATVYMEDGSNVMLPLTMWNDMWAILWKWIDYCDMVGWRQASLTWHEFLTRAKEEVDNEFADKAIDEAIYSHKKEGESID